MSLARAFVAGFQDVFVSGWATWLACALAVYVSLVFFYTMRRFGPVPLPPCRPRTVYDFSPATPDPGCFEQ